MKAAVLLLLVSVVLVLAGCASHTCAMCGQKDATQTAAGAANPEGGAHKH